MNKKWLKAAGVRAVRTFFRLLLQQSAQLQ